MSAPSQPSSNGHADALTAAQSYLAAGLSIIPVARDGSKRPDSGRLPRVPGDDGRSHASWDQFKAEPPTREVVALWFRGTRPPGIGVICGAVSGGLETLDFDARAEDIFPAWCELVEAEAPGLVARLSIARTPKPGYHVRYRCPDMPIPGNTKLATDPAAAPDERCLIETRGEGGYAIAPGSPAEVHKTGRPYEHYTGPPLERVQPIGIGERDTLIRCARSFDRSPLPEPAKPKSARGAGLSPGDDYDRRGPDWPAILEPHGWVAVHHRGTVTHWRRPGKDGPGWSATTGACISRAGRSLFYVFSSNAAPFEAERGYSKFAAYTLLNHGGDFSAAAKSMAERGYGEQRSLPSRNGIDRDHTTNQTHGTREAEEVAEAEDDPHRLARLYLDDHTTDNGRAVQYWREEFLEWNGSAYRGLPEKELKARLCNRIKEEFDRLNVIALRKWGESGGVDGDGKPIPKPYARKVTTRLLADVQQALSGLIVLPSSMESPAWINEESNPPPRFPATEVLACRNGLLHLPSFANGQTRLLPPTPRFFSPTTLDYDFDPKAPEPRTWLTFLRQLWPDDVQAINTLQEWFGYTLLPDTTQQKILMIVGPRRSGKGTIGRVLRRVIGMQNTAGPTLAGLGTNFGLWPLLDKTLAIISDARLSGRTDVAVVTERLLSISGEDAQTIDRKNMRPVTTKLSVRFVVMTNELPRLNDPSGALVGRLIILRQTQSWYGKEDIGLTEKLLAELPSILMWSLEGWKRLQNRRRFEQPQSGLKLVAEMEDLSSPIGQFIREHCVIGSGLEAPMRGLFQRWCRWCETVGRRDTGTEQTFGRDLRAAVPGLDDRQHRQTDGSRRRVYIGIGLRPEESEEWPPSG
jgi:putative DNA primase/helicase